MFDFGEVLWMIFKLNNYFGDLVFTFALQIICIYKLIVLSVTHSNINTQALFPTIFLFIVLIYTLSWLH
jgi:hypothetical protein